MLRCSLAILIGFSTYIGVAISQPDLDRTPRNVELPIQETAIHILSDRVDTYRVARNEALNVNYNYEIHGVADNDAALYAQICTNRITRCEVIDLGFAANGIHQFEHTFADNSFINDRDFYSITLFVRKDDTLIKDSVNIVALKSS